TFGPGPRARPVGRTGGVPPNVPTVTLVGFDGAKKTTCDPFGSSNQIVFPGNPPPMFPEMMSPGLLPFGSPEGNSVIFPAVVIFANLFAWASVNHRLWSGPTVMPDGKLFAVGILNWENFPAVVIRPILLPVVSVNQMA